MTSSATPPLDPNDPVLARRAQIAKWCATANRYGYLAVLAAMIVFVVGFFVGFNSVVVAVVIGLIVVSGLLLIPAMIFGYGVKMAEKEERGEKFTY